MRGIVFVLSLAAVAAGLAAGCLSNRSQLDPYDTETGEAPECGDYGYGETTCDEVAEHLMVCCVESLEDMCEVEIISYQSHCEMDELAGILDHCSCDDCEETGSEECEEFRSCIKACNGSSFLPE